MPKVSSVIVLCAMMLSLLAAGSAWAEPRLRIHSPMAARNECPAGYHWDSELGKCLADREGGQPCPAMYYWSSYEKRCVKRNGDCPNGQYWHTDKQRCVHPTCPRGFRWSESQGHCVRF